VYFVCVFVFRLELLLQRANKIQNMTLDCEEKLTLAKNTLQAVSMGLSLWELSHKLFSKKLFTCLVYIDNCLLKWK